MRKLENFESLESKARAYLDAAHASTQLKTTVTLLVEAALHIGYMRGVAEILPFSVDQDDTMAVIQGLTNRLWGMVDATHDAKFV